MADDRYDHAIDYLMRHPEQIEFAWQFCNTHVAGCLFQYVHGRKCKSRKCIHGCLTMIRSQYHEYCNAPNEKLTTAIRADTRLPTDVNEIRLHHLPIFAEWQRKLDKELNR